MAEKTVVWRVAWKVENMAVKMAERTVVWRVA